MCLLSEALLNCVRTYILLMSEFMQLLIGISINRYLPANGTAGFALIFVNGYRRDPFPPPRMMASTLFMKAVLIGYFEKPTG